MQLDHELRQECFTINERIGIGALSRRQPGNQATEYSKHPPSKNLPFLKCSKIGSCILGYLSAI